MESLGHYSIVEKLGEGGMGTVFKARDTRLDRFVALKILRADLVLDERAKTRFIVEARAASALNHPNIIHIYDISTTDSIDFIVMEYVAGRTLERLIGGKPLSVNDVLKYAVAIADALDVAHQQGIVHRDLKPGNIMVTERDLIKVLDFGLAKLIEPEPPTGGVLPDSDTVSMLTTPRTAAGVAVGTPAYMSPEQAEGRKVDARSDIFSFGVVLYQMITGVRPFTGNSSLGILASVLRDQPAPVSTLVPDVPAELESLVARCLQKDPDQRFGAMHEVKRALQDVSEHRSWEQHSARHSSATVLKPAGSHRRWFWPALSVILAIVATAPLIWIWAVRDNPASRDVGLTRLTSEDGLDTTPAISPDGKLMVYASDRSGEGNLDLWLRQIGSNGQAIRLTRDPADDYEPSFSADGTRIAFRSERNGGGIYVMPSLGGEEQLLVPLGRRPKFSPDGKKIAYWTGRARDATSTRSGWGKLFVIDASGGTPVPVQPDFEGAIHPIWAPDGKHLLFIGTKNISQSVAASWWVTSIAGGDAVDVGFQASLPTGRAQGLLRSPVAWYKNRVIYSETEAEKADVREIAISSGSWKIDGEPRRLTVGTTRDSFPSISADGRLIFCSLISNLDVFSLPVNPDKGTVNGELQRVTSNSSYNSVRDISRDGKRIVFLSNRSSDHLEVWAKDFQTGAERQLTNSAVGKRQPVISPDGQSVAFAEDGTGANSIYLIPFAGGPQRRLCEKCGTQSGWFPDGKQLLFTNYAAPHNPISVLDVESGATQLVLVHPRYSLFPRSVSPDGKWISLGVDRGREGVPLAVAPLRPGKPAPESDWIFLTDGSATDAYPRWSPDGNTIYFTSDQSGAMTLFAQRLDPASRRPAGRPAALYRIAKPSLRLSPVAMWISVAQDRIVFSLEEVKGNIWMLQLGG